MANRMIYMHTAAVVREMRVTVNPDQRIPEATADFVSDAVMRACDVLGEGFLNNPRQCEFDFSTLACGAGQSGGQCLSPGQLETVETFYGGVRNSAGESIFAGQAPGNPLPAMTGFDPAGNPGYGFDTIRYWGFQDEDYDWRNFDLDRDMPGIIENVGYVNSIDPDLREFKRNGGKLLLYAGWGDTAISPENTAYYYETVLDEMGRDQFVRDEAPDRLVGTNRQSGLTRPVCPYPQYARYDGTGAPGEASSWSCAAP